MIDVTGVQKELISRVAYFKTDKHREAYVDIVSTGLIRNRRLAAAAYLLTVFPVLSAYISEGRINFEKVLDRTIVWSSGEKALIKLAAHLYDPSRWSGNIDDVFYILDEDNTRVALEALRIMYS